MFAIRALIAFSATLVVALGAEASSKPVPSAKAVKQAESKLKKLLKEGEDRPSVYAARVDLVAALRSLDSCDELGRIDRELELIIAWVERSAIPVRLSPQLVYNEAGRTAQAHASCAEDEAQQKSWHEKALSAFARAREAAKKDYDPLNEAITLYNASQSAEALGDLPRALALMEEACAIDREFALDDNYREDYPELVRLRDEKNGTETPPEAIEQHLAALAEDKVRFTYKPTHGERQSYRSELHELSVSGAQRHERKVELQYASLISVKDDLVTVAMQPGESKVDGRDAKVVAAEAQPGDLTAERLVARLLAQPLSFTVKTNGEFVGAAGLDEMRRTVLASVDEAFAGAPPSDQRDLARKLVEQLLSDGVINQQIATEWTMAVGWWIDAELDIGDWYSLVVDAPQAATTGTALKFNYVFKVNRRIACGPTDAKKACVELIIEGTPDREQFADYLIGFMTQLADPQPRKQTRWFRARLAEDVELVERHVLVVDPATLKTYKQIRTKKTFVSGADRDTPPKIELQTTRAELQQPVPEQKRVPATSSRKVTAGKK
jgi:tetratricopeptide (TPR) repeat protein